MAIIQPLYYPGGRYKASDDRKIFTALSNFESDGTKTQGVVGSPNLTTTTGLMKVAAGSTGTFTVQPGLCVIADAATQSAANPGVYLAGIDSTALTISTQNLVTLPLSGTRTDLVYALIDETPYTVTTASRTTTTVTLTTSASHNAKIGDTVVVTGLDEVFNGSYTAISPTSGTTITYSTSSSGTISSTTYNATAQRIDSQGTTLGSAIVITNRSFAQSGTTAIGTATITTTSIHSLAIGDTVRISGLSSVFDGDYVVQTVPTTTTFTYSRSWNGTAVTALGVAAAQNSANAQVRVPFSIRMVSGSTTMPSVTGIPLANVTVDTAGSITAPVDRRFFTSTNGGVMYYDSTAGGSTNALRPAVAAEGRLAYDVNANKLYYSDGTNWLEFSNTSHNHDTTYYPAPQSVAGTLTKPTSYATVVTASSISGSAYTGANGSDILDTSVTPSVSVAASVTCIAACYVLVEFSINLTNISTSGIAQVDIHATGATTTPAAFVVATSGSNSRAATDGTAMTQGDWIYHSNAAYGGSGISHLRRKLVKVNSGTTTFTLRGKINNSAYSVQVTGAAIRIIPLYNA